MAGQNQSQIAHEEECDRHTVARIIKSEEMSAFVEQMKERLRGLSEPAIEVLRDCLAKGDKEVAFRILETCGIIAPAGRVLQHNIQPQNPSTSEEDPVRSLMCEFGRVGMERARAYRTPMPELEEAADKIGIELNLNENSLSGEDYNEV
jgi:hypothetical protein